MKKPLAAIAALFLMVPALPAQADYRQGGGVRERTCYKEVYREEYIPGTRERPGRVRRWTEKKEVPCRNRRPNPRPAPHRDNDYDDNSCVEGAILGGIAGAAGGAALSRGDGRWIGSPLGIVGGSMIGCQIDGG